MSNSFSYSSANSLIAYSTDVEKSNHRVSELQQTTAVVKRSHMYNCNFNTSNKSEKGKTWLLRSVK